MLSIAGFVLAGAWYVDGTRAVPDAPTNPAPDHSGDTTGKPNAAPAAWDEHAPQRTPPSRCIGHVNAGVLENGWRLPSHGANFQAYSGLGVALGRTFVHDVVFDIVLAAYAEVQRTHPELQFVYGETGLRNGGRFRPHRTHQTGTSVDFMIPVRDERGAPAVLPTSVANKWGYGIDFDSEGRWNGLTVDFEAVSTHLAALRRTAASRGAPIAKVVLFPPIRRKLIGTRAWSRIADLPFTKKESWVRHDDHYHVDFAVRCRGK